MKTILAAFLIASMTSAAHATITDEQINACSNIGKFAGVIMLRRQTGISIDDQLALVSKGNKPIRDTTRQFVITLVIEANDIPVYSEGELKDLAITLFADEMQRRCLKLVNQ